MNPHLPGGLVPMMMPQQYMMAVRLPAGMPPPSHGQPIVAGAGVQAVQGIQGLAQSPVLPAHLSASPSPQAAGLAVSVPSTTSASASGAASQAALMSMTTSPIPGAQVHVGASSLSGSLLSSPYGIPLTGVTQASMSVAGLTGSPMGSHIAVAGAQIPGLTGAQMATLPGAGQVAGVAAGGYAQQGLAGLTSAQLAGLSAQHVAAGFPGAAQFPGAQLPPGYGNHIAGAGGLAGLQMAMPQAIPVPSASPPAIGAQGDSKKRVVQELAGLQMASAGAEYQIQQPQSHTPSQPSEQDSMDDSIVVLDDYNSDLHLVIDPDGYGAQPLVEPPGFCFCWAGARCTHGICRGKAYYEVKLVEELPVDFGEDHQETDPHILRVGWSMDSTSFQLGEEDHSFGFGGTGKFSDNNKFRNYGERFGVGDVIGALLDLDSRAPNISYAKNGRWLGVAKPLTGFQIGNRDKALFPHILSKNVRFEVNFGQQAPWFPPAPGFMYIMQYPVTDRIRGLKPPTSKSSCEMIMIIGLPGAGKTTWGINKARDNPEMRYNIIGTDTLIDKMRVMGLPRKKNYHGRWDVLIDKASKCLNKLFEIASKKKRNLILDQTNVYPSARRRKMKNFRGFIRRAAVMVPDDPELIRRSEKRTYEDGKYVPEEAVLDMKANFKLPLENDDNFDYIEYTDLPREKALPLVEAYNREGQLKRPQAVRGGGGHGGQGFKPPSDMKQTSAPQGAQIKQQFPHQIGGQGMPQHGGPPLPPHGAPQPPPPPPPDQYQRDRRDHSNEPPEKRLRYDPSGGSALDFIKQEYSTGEAEAAAEHAQVHAGLQAQQQFQEKKPEQAWQGDFAAVQFQQQHVQQFAGRGLVIGAQAHFSLQPGAGILGEYGSNQEQIRATAYGAQQDTFSGFNPPVQIKQEQQDNRPGQNLGSWQTQGQSQWQDQNRQQNQNQNRPQSGFDARGQGQGQGDFRGQQTNQWGGQNFHQDVQGQGQIRNQQNLGGQTQRNTGNRPDSSNRPESGFRGNRPEPGIGINRPDSGFGGNRPDSGFGGSRGMGNQQQKQQEQSNVQQSRPPSRPYQSDNQGRNQPGQAGGNQRPGFGGQNRGGRESNDNRNVRDNQQNMGGQSGFSGGSSGRLQDSQNQFANFGNQNVQHQQQKPIESQDQDKPKRERRRPSKWDTPDDKADENPVSEAEAQQDFENALSSLRTKIANNQTEVPTNENQNNQAPSEKPKEQLSEVQNNEMDSKANKETAVPPQGDQGPGPRGDFGPRGGKEFMGPRGPRGPPPFGQPGGMMEGFRPRGPGMDGPPPFRGGRGGRGGFPDRGGRGGPPRPFRPRGEGDEGPRGPPGSGGPPPGLSGPPGGPGWNPRPGGPGPRGFNPRLPGMGPGGPRGPPFQHGPPGRFQRPPMGQRWQRPPR